MREAQALPEAVEPEVALKAMTAGAEVVQDYRHVGLSLREHPVAFLRRRLQARGVIPRPHPRAMVATRRSRG